MLFFHPEQETPSVASPPSGLPRSPLQGQGGCELDSARLLQGQREVLIRHGCECYRLRHTRNGKLILTK